MKCINCGKELEKDYNYCPNCGELTAHGIINLKENKQVRKEDNLGELFTIVSLLIITLTIVTLLQGKNILRPYIELKKEIQSLKYGYKISPINTTNQYTSAQIKTHEEALEKIKEDNIKQSWQCKKNAKVSIIEKEISEEYNITSVNLCDISEEESLKIKQTIDKIYNTYPNIKNYLTNITVTNAEPKDNYIAYFEPIYTFVNTNKDINKYNQVNKTQILLNSYYYLNNKTLKQTIKGNYYPNGATYESLIAHELGHYISFVTLLKQNNISNITLITKDNYEAYKEVLNKLDTQSYSQSLIEEAIKNYNTNNKTNISIKEFAQNISTYACGKNKIIYDEIIAEAVHDYYLHENTSSPSTKEIIKILKERLI